MSESIYVHLDGGKHCEQWTQVDMDCPHCEHHSVFERGYGGHNWDDDPILQCGFCEATFTQSGKPLTDAGGPERKQALKEAST